MLKKTAAHVANAIGMVLPALSAALAACCAYFAFVCKNTAFYQENGLLENGQALMVATSAAAYLYLNHRIPQKRLYQVSCFLANRTVFLAMAARASASVVSPRRWATMVLTPR